jgi:hypothetical protein
VMLSGYASPLYSETLAGWQETRIHGSRTQRNQPTVELVWSNRVLRRDLPAPMIGQAVAGTQMGLLDPPQEVITE